MRCQRLAAGAVLAVALVLAVCRFACSWAGQAPPRGEPHRVRLGYSYGLVSGVNENDAAIAMRVWADVLAKEMGKGYVFDSALYRDLPVLVRAAAEQPLDFVALLSLDYLRYGAGMGLTPGLMLVSGDRAAREHVLLVRRDARIKDIADLKGAEVLILPGGEGRLEVLWADCLLMRRGLPGSANHFGSLKQAKDPNRAIMSVFFKQSEACLVTARCLETVKELNPQVGRSLTALAKSPPLLAAVVCYTPHISDRERSDIEAAARELHRFARGKQILTLLKSDRLVVFQPSELEGVRALVNERNAVEAQREKR